MFSIIASSFGLQHCQISHALKSFQTFKTCGVVFCTSTSFTTAAAQKKLCIVIQTITTCMADYQWGLIYLQGTSGKRKMATSVQPDSTITGYWNILNAHAYLHKRQDIVHLWFNVDASTSRGEEVWLASSRCRMKYSKHTLCVGHDMLWTPQCTRWAAGCSALIWQAHNIASSNKYLVKITQWGNVVGASKCVNLLKQAGLSHRIDSQQVNAESQCTGSGLIPVYNIK